MAVLLLFKFDEIIELANGEMDALEEGDVADEVELDDEMEEGDSDELFRVDLVVLLFGFESMAGHTELNSFLLLKLL